MGCSLVEHISGEKVKLSKWKNFTIKSQNSPYLTLGEAYEGTVEAKEDGKYGTTYELVKIKEVSNLETEEGKKAFLQSVLTNKQIESLYAVHEDPYTLIKNEEIEELIKCKGIKQATAKKLIKTYKENVVYAEIMASLPEYELTRHMMASLLNRYVTSQMVVDKVRDNVYVLSEEVDGIGFKKCDAIALTGGMPENSPKRLNAFIKFCLNDEASNGNTWIAPQVLVGQIREEFGDIFSDEDIRDSWYKLHDKNELYWDETKTKIALKKYYNIENKICKLLKKIASEPITLVRDLEAENKIIKTIEEENGYEFTEQQKEALSGILDNKVCLLTGWAGCVDCDTEFFTGIEWKRMADYTEGDKVLQYNPDGTAITTLPNKYIKTPAEYLWHFSTKYGIDQCLCDAHQVLYESAKGRRYVETFAEIKARYEETGKFGGKFLTTFNYTGEGIELSDEEIRVMCMVICDGHFANNTKRCSVRLKKERKKIRLRQLLKQAEIDFTEQECNGKVKGFSVFKFNSPRREKVFGADWYACSNHQLSVVCDEILYWDGCLQETKKGSIRKSFSSNVKETIDFVQFAYASIGVRSVVRTYDRVGEEYQTAGKTYLRKSIKYSLTISGRSNRVGICDDDRVGHKKTEIEKYKTVDGFKYCFEVPSGLLVLRRKGKIFVTHNCGKSTVIRAIMAIFEHYGLFVSASSFSAKAASRIYEATGFEGSTIHRLLGSQGAGDFKNDERNPLLQDAIIIDESSFLGGDLLLSLLKACLPKVRLIFVGDPNQLPSISIGNVFYDMEKSGKFYVGRLTQIHRQAQKSGIVTASRDVREGKQIFGRGWTGQEIKGELQDFLLDIYAEREFGIPKCLEHYKHFVKSLKDVPSTQILLAKKNSGEVCTYEINNMIQEMLNPPTFGKQEMKVTKNFKSYFLRIGDRVINVKNNYKAKIYDPYALKERTGEVFNGFSGTVIEIFEDNVVVKFDLIDEPILFERDSVSNLELAYAITIHKSQGSEFKNLIFLMDYSSYIMNTKEALYTAITRASEKCVLVGEAGAVRMAIQTSATKTKQTFLEEMLRKENDN